MWAEASAYYTDPFWDFWKSFTNFQGRWRRKKVWRGNKLHWCYTEQLNYWTNMFQLVVFIRVFAGLPSWNTMMISGFRSLYVHSFPSLFSGITLLLLSPPVLFCLSVCNVKSIWKQKHVCPCSEVSAVCCWVVTYCHPVMKQLNCWTYSNSVAHTF